MITLGIVLLTLVVFTIVYMNTAPQFGGSHSKEDVVKYENSGHYADGTFQNLIPTSIDYSWSSMVRMMKLYIKGNPNKSPQSELPTQDLDTASWNSANTDQIMWYGHSAFLLKMNEKTILIDPMLGNTPAPHPALGASRYSKELPVEIEELQEVDLIIISHDHYDHLDYGSIKQLNAKTKMFYVPLGVGAHLKKWGVSEDRIKEFNWWDEAKLETIDIAFTPARHFSGRKIGNNNTTLWGSWVLKGSNTKIFFSGDSGYGPHFEEIGNKYGPFDITLMECGQYNENWDQIHMMPEESVKAAKDVQAKVMMPIHWGAFTLAMHDWNDPVKRSTAEAERLAIDCITPVIGEVIALDTISVTQNEWWK